MKSKSYSIKDLNADEPVKPVTLKGFRDLSDNKRMENNKTEEIMDQNIRLVIGVLAGENFIIASTHQRSKSHLRPINSYAGQTLTSSNKIVTSFITNEFVKPVILQFPKLLNGHSKDGDISVHNAGILTPECQRQPIVTSANVPLSKTNRESNQSFKIDETKGIINRGFEADSIRSVT